ncbi:MAG: flagella basal body P-ring formation protein FlgA [Motiliproteus sp.]
MFKGRLILSTWFILWVGCQTAQAMDLSLTEQAKVFLQLQLQPHVDPGDQLRIQLDKPDSRLQLEPCGTALTFSSSRAIQAGSFSLKASCDYPRRWSRYLHGKVQLLREVLISTRALSPGHLLQANDMRLTAVDQNSLRDGFYTRGPQILGYALNRSLADNQPFSPKLLTPPVLIQQGETVRIQAGNNGITVEMAGTALESGALNQQIKIRNNRSERVITARVTGYGTARALR